MIFMKAIVKEYVNGKPAILGSNEVKIVLNLDNIVYFNKSNDSEDEIFARMASGETLCLALNYEEFEALMTGADVGEDIEG